MLEIAGSADATVENLLDARVATLPDDLRRKINLVMRRPNTGTQLRPPDRSDFDSEALLHRCDRASKQSPKSVPFFPE